MVARPSRYGITTMTETAAHQALVDVVDQYFETMFDNDIGRFDRVFAPTAQLHGLRDGKLRVLPVAEYRKVLASGPSPRSRRHPGTRRSCRSTLLHRFRRWSRSGCGSIRFSMSTISASTGSTGRGVSPPSPFISSGASSRSAYAIALAICARTPSDRR